MHDVCRHSGIRVRGGDSESFDPFRVSKRNGGPVPDDDMQAGIGGVLNRDEVMGRFAKRFQDGPFAQA